MIDLYIQSALGRFCIFFWLAYLFTSNFKHKGWAFGFSFGFMWFYIS